METTPPRKISIQRKSFKLRICFTHKRHKSFLNFDSTRIIFILKEVNTDLK